MKHTWVRFSKYISVLLAAVLVLSLVPLGAAGDSAEAEQSAQEVEQELEQEIAVDPTGKGEGYSAVLYDNTSGLPTSEANAIVETREGFIWIGSYSGLIRYDGSTFERYDSTGGIASVVSLFVDSRDRLWVGTNDSGAAVMEKGEFSFYNKEDGLSSLSVRAITEDPEGNVYLATTHGLAYVDPDMQLHNIDEPQINDEYIRSLDAEGDTVYGVTMNGAIFVLRDRKLTAYYGADKLGITDTHSILLDQDHPGYVYIGNKGSKLYYGKLEDGFHNARSYDISPLGYINDIESVADMIWLCTDSGIGFIHNDTVVTVNNIPMTTSVERMITDYMGNLWFVSSQQGVMKIVPNQFTDVFEQCDLEDEVVYSTCMLEGQLFVGTKNRGLIVLNEDHELVEHIPVRSSRTASGIAQSDTDLVELLAGSKIRSIIRDSRDRIWFSTFGENGLVRYVDGVIVKFTKADGLPSDRVRAVYERADGSFMVACTGGLAIIENEKVTQVFDESDGISNTEILTAVENTSGEMVVGTDGGGIYVLSGTGVKRLGTGDGLNSDVVMRLKNDRTRDLVWIVTSNSIAYMDKDHKITTVKNFPYSNNFDLYENSRGEMWVLSSNGIYVAQVDQLVKNEEITPLYYGQDNGLPCITTSNSYSELTPDGDLYISGTSGVAKVNIEKGFENVSDIKMAVPFLEADGKQIYPDKNGKFTVPSGTARLTIYSFVYNYSLVNPDVTYRLEGFESRSTTLKRSDLVPLNYTNLRGGDYTFRMEIRDPQGDTSKELQVIITKEKAIYEQIWFMVMVMLLAIILLAVVVRLIIEHRTAKFLQKEQEQRTLIREIVEAFAKVIDMKDKYTNGHSTRVAEYTRMLCEELGLDEETVEKYYNIALLHDIGKVGIPPEVLNKPGKLTDTEFNIIKSHSALGYETLKNISIMPELAIGAGSHHERPDGRGYPKGLKGDQIPRVAQIIAVADTFDAMYSDRPYRKRMNFEKAVSIVQEVRGTQLTEDVVDAFMRLVEKGKFRDPDDHGGGTTEDIDNIHKRQAKEQPQDKPEDKSDDTKPEDTSDGGDKKE